MHQCSTARPSITSNFQSGVAPKPSGKSHTVQCCQWIPHTMCGLPTTNSSRCIFLLRQIHSHTGSTHWDDKQCPTMWGSPECMKENEQEVLSLLQSANSVQSSTHVSPSKTDNTSNQNKRKCAGKSHLQHCKYCWTKLCTIDPSATAKLTTTSMMLLSATCLVALLQNDINWKNDN